MTAPAGFLEFFILEASEYVEQLDGLLLGAGSSGPDSAAFQRTARALRGTATMAKLGPFADVAAALERVGRVLQDGALRWEPALRSALVAAVDDLKILLHAVRTWSSNDDARARARASELSSFLPGTAHAAAAQAAATTTAAPFLAGEAANIAAGLELLTTRPGDIATAANVLKRVRALRGVAGVSSVASLADALEATEDAARGLETGSGGMTPQARALLEAAAAHLRTLSTVMRGGGDVNAPSPTRDTFNAAVEAWSASTSERERVVPISELFYGDSEGVVETASAPPTSASERFRLELVSQGEHLREVVNAARLSRDSTAISRSQRDLRRALRALQAAAESFGETEVSALIGERTASLSLLDPRAFQIDSRVLDDLNSVAAILTDATAPGTDLRTRLRHLAARTAARTPTPIASQPAVPRPTPEPVRARTPARVAALLDSGIVAIESLNGQPLAAAVEIPEDRLVPIDTLLYRGRAALDRAVEIRDELRGSDKPADKAALDELFELLDLARSDDWE
jgi:chemotaxis protein histidine kinase CheA